MLPLLLLLLSRLPAPATPTVEENVVIEGTRLPDSVASTPARVIVLSREDIERTAAVTLDDVLRHVPGFSPFRRASSLTANPTTQGVSLRGLGGTATSRTLVLVDGRPLNDPFASWVAWGRVPATSIERIEIVPAGVATAWGDLALAGAINVVTRRDEHGSQLLQAGERGTSVLDVSLLRGDRVAWRVSARESRTDGWPVVRQDQRGPIDVAADSRSSSLRLGAGGAAGARSRWDVSLSGFDEDRGNGTPLTGNSTRLGELDAQWSRDLPKSGTLRFDVMRTDETFESTFSSQAADRASETPTLDQRVPSRSTGMSFGWTSSPASSERWRASAGLDARRTEGATHELFRRMNGAFTRRRFAGGAQGVVGAYGQASRLVGSKLELSFGLRVDSWRSFDGRRLERDIATGNVTRDESPSDRSEWLASPRAGLVVQSAPGWSERLALSRGFRAPTLNELYRPFRVRDDVTEASASLDPETATTVEAGVDREGARAAVHLTVAQARLQDAIANETVGAGPGTVDPCGFVAAGGTCRVRANVGTALVRSLEAAARWRLGTRWSCGVDALWLDARMRSGGALKGKRLAEVPRVQADAWLERAGERASMGLELRRVGRAFEDDRNALPLRSGVVLDGTFRFRVTRAWEVGVTAQNVLDERLESARTADGLVSVAGPRLLLASLRWRPADDGRHP